MIIKKPIYIFVTGFIIIIAIVIGFIYIKFNYYEKEIKSKIILHNQLLSEYYGNYFKLDSNVSSKYDKYDFYYLSGNLKLKKVFGINYEKYLDWLRKRINKIRLLNDEMKRLIMKSQYDDSISKELNELLIEGSKYDSIRREKRKMYYTNEELMNFH